MSEERTDRVRDVGTSRQDNAKPLRRLPQRSTTKQMHQRLLRALGDRRLRRAFD
jgi:hypothetical protein